jgi:hypothetical protein
MNFTPKTERQIIEDMLWEKGEYEFEVIAAKEGTSHQGNEMFTLKLRIADGSGRSRTLTDYLLPSVPRKFRHAAEACGLGDKYSTGSISDTDFVGKRGKLKLGVERDGERKYSDKNVVVDYVWL